MAGYTDGPLKVIDAHNSIGGRQQSTRPKSARAKSVPLSGANALNGKPAVFRPIVQRMAPYLPGEQPGTGQRLIKLNTNENPYPPSPAVRRAVIKAQSGEAIRLYPPPRADQFVAAASQVYRIPPAMILAGNGSDELLAMLFRAALSRAERVAYATPTYSLYDTLATIQEARVVAIPFMAGFRLPIQALTRARARLTIVCNPNSPSGTLVDTDTLDRLAIGLKGRLLAIDEAYVDFADRNALGLVKRHRNVLVLRTLSKSYSLAGMRLGLCFGDPAVIATLLKVKDSYNLSRPAIAAGAAALKDQASMRRNVERVRVTRASTEKRLRQMGFEVPESAANFVMARIPGHDLAPIASGLRARGILVRYFATPMLSDALRISIGRPRQMRALFKALEMLMIPLRATPRASSLA